MTNPQPHRRVSPGEIFKEEMDARWWGRAFVQSNLGLTYFELDDFLDGRLEMSGGLAGRLSGLVGNSVEFWQNLERSYRASFGDET